MIARYRGERRVLVVGRGFDQPHVAEALDSLAVPLLVWVRLDRWSGPRARSIVANPACLPIRSGAVDLVLAPSLVTPPRVALGGDGTGAVRDSCVRAANELVRETATLVAPGGRVLLTIPFAHSPESELPGVVDPTWLRRLASDSGLALRWVELFRYRHGWAGPVLPPLSGHSRDDQDGMRTNAVACLELVRAEGTRSVQRRASARP
jgi:hypothetical protein